MIETSCEVEINQEFNIKHRRKLTVVYIRCLTGSHIVGPLWGHKLPLLVLEGIADLDDRCNCGGWHCADTQFREEITQLRERLETLNAMYQVAGFQEAISISEEAVRIEEQIEAIKREDLPWNTKTT